MFRVNDPDRARRRVKDADDARALERCRSAPKREPEQAGRRDDGQRMRIYPVALCALVLLALLCLVAHAPREERSEETR